MIHTCSARIPAARFERFFKAILRSPYCGTDCSDLAPENRFYNALHISRILCRVKIQSIEAQKDDQQQITCLMRYPIKNSGMDSRGFFPLSAFESLIAFACVCIIHQASSFIQTKSLEYVENVLNSLTCRIAVTCVVNCLTGTGLPPSYTLKDTPFEAPSLSNISNVFIFELLWESEFCVFSIVWLNFFVKAFEGKSVGK